MQKKVKPLTDGDNLMERTRALVCMRRVGARDDSELYLRGFMAIFHPEYDEVSRGEFVKPATKTVKKKKGRKR